MAGGKNRVTKNLVFVTLAGKPEGRIYMSGSILKRGKNSWLLRYELPRRADGKRRQGTETVHGTKKDAEKRLREILINMDHGDYIEPCKMSVKEYMLEWLQNYTFTNTRTTTYEMYSSLICQHIIPELGNIPLAKLAPIHLQQFLIKKMMDGGRVDGKPGGLSTKTVRHLYAILREALSQAVEMNIIAKNPAVRVKQPKLKQKEIKFFSEEQVKSFIRASEGTRFHCLFMMALGTGLRRGELLALQWQDIDFENSMVTVNKTLVKTKNGLKIQPPKTKSSRRTVSLPFTVNELLKKHKVEQNKLKLRQGVSYIDNGLVFCSINGNPLNPDNLVKRYFYPIISKAGLPRITFHGLRHTHATIMLARGENVKVVSERLGHTNVAFTIKTYGHVMPNMQAEAAKRFDDVLSV